MSDFALFTAPNTADGRSEEFTGAALRYQHSIRRQGGFWAASWDMKPSVVTPHRILEAWFDNKLGHVVYERSAGLLTWRGIIWSMDLAIDGWKERKDLGEVWNAVKVVYTTDAATAETDWFTNDTSIARYGRREYIIPLDGVTQATAEAEAQKTLIEAGEAIARPVGVGKDIEDSLHVEAVGFVFTANNKYVTAGDGTEDDLSTFYSEIVAADCEFLTAGSIAPNTTQVRKSFQTPMRVWDALMHLTMVGSTSAPFLTEVDASDFIHFRQASNEPAYLWQGKEKGLTTRGGTPMRWAARPGVVRNMKKRPSTAIPGTFLQQDRDVWIGEVTMADGQDTIDVTPEGYDDEAINREFERAKKWLEEEEEAASGD
ncbi:MAG: hypothetical protein IT327_07830 [Anaerolineae bacterium]|nr:hypothetical protein [Anaerolineae bacterium]